MIIIGDFGHRERILEERTDKKIASMTNKELLKWKEELKTGKVPMKNLLIPGLTLGATGGITTGAITKARSATRGINNGNGKVGKLGTAIGAAASTAAGAGIGYYGYKKWTKELIDKIDTELNMRNRNSRSSKEQYNIFIPENITIEQKKNTISNEALDLLNEYSVESILEAFITCESSGLYSIEAKARKFTPEELKAMGFKTFEHKTFEPKTFEFKTFEHKKINPGSNSNITTKQGLLNKFKNLSNGKKAGIIAGGLAATGALAYGGYKGIKAIKNKKQTAAESILAMYEEE